MSPVIIPEDRHVLIAGPTASGKSALALFIAREQGGMIVNADALQVFDGWHILTARPPSEDLAQARHELYGHIPFDQPYSVGEWLRDLRPFLTQGRLIIVGGTGLYLSALTDGLADIPATRPEVREQADARDLTVLIHELDAETAGRIDLNNRARVQRAWEVQKQTGRSLFEWQKQTTSPLVQKDDCVKLVLDAPKDWLTPRIEQRFSTMLDSGALQEAQAMKAQWNPAHPSSKAIGAKELIAHLNGDMTLEKATELSVIATRQYAKRQRTWFNKRMKDWHWISMSSATYKENFTFVKK